MAILNAPDRIYAEYRNKPKAVAWYKISPTIGEQLAQCFTDIRYSYSIDDSYGELLNIIGRVVGIDRGVIGQIDLTTYQFIPDPHYSGSEYDGSAFYDGSVSYDAISDDIDVEFGNDEAQFSALSVATDQDLEDAYFKVLIKAKIFRNSSSVTIEDILFLFGQIFENAGDIRINDNEDMSFSIEFDGLISEIARQILLTKNVIPKPQGVKFTGYLESYGMVESDDSDLEFGDESAEFVGYIGV